MIAEGELPATFLFQTREGSAGVLQILAVEADESPRHVKIRYKLVAYAPGSETKPRLQFRLVAEPGDTAPAEEFPDPDDRTGKAPRVRVLKEVLLDESAVAWATPRPDGEGSCQVMVEFTEAGGKKILEITGKNVGRRMAVIFDGGLVTKPVIRAPIESRAMITGRISWADAESIVRAIAARRGPASEAGAPAPE
jgi:hypothetical protein